MGKTLIIRGANFSADGIKPEIVWNNEFIEPDTDSMYYFACGDVNNNYIGVYYSEGAVVDGIKLSLLPTTQESSTYSRNLQVGDSLKFAKVSTVSPFDKQIVANVVLTENDFENGYIIVNIQQIQLSSSEFIGVCKAVSSMPTVAIPCTYNNNPEGSPDGRWLNAAGTYVNIITVTGIATYYFV